jgi:hypothetical protein
MVSLCLRQQSYYGVASNEDNSYNACMSKYLIFSLLYLIPLLFSNNFLRSKEQIVIQTSNISNISRIKFQGEFRGIKVSYFVT